MEDPSPAADHLATICRRAGALASVALLGLLVSAPGPAAAAGPGPRAQADVEQVEGARVKPGKVKPTAKGATPLKVQGRDEDEDEDEDEGSGEGGPPVRADVEDERPAVDQRQDEDLVQGASPEAGDGKTAVPPTPGTAVEPSAPPESSPPAPPEPDAGDRSEEDTSDGDTAAAPVEPDEEGVLSAGLKRTGPPTGQATANGSVVRYTAPAAAASATSGLGEGALRAAAASSTSGHGEGALRPARADDETTAEEETTAAVARSRPPQAGAGAAEVVDKLSGTTRAMGQAAQEHSGVAATTVAIAVLIAAYLFVHGHFDRRDPKLARAPYDDDLIFE